MNLLRGSLREFGIVVPVGIERGQTIVSEALVLVHCPRHQSAMPIHQQVPNSADFLRSQPLSRCRLVWRMTGSSRAHFHRTIVTVLDVRMILVAGDQQKFAQITIGEDAAT